MRRLKIRNLGALKDVDIEFSQVNVIIGPQSFLSLWERVRFSRWQVIALGWRSVLN